MQLNRKNLSLLKQEKITAPADALFELPEKVLQFGTGVLLRGLPDYFIDKANRQQVFNGRVVVIKSTTTGDTKAFKEQDGLFTLLERGLENGERIERVTLNASISRVLSANEEWDEILQCAGNPDMQLIISNTTEIGIVLVESDAQAVKPVSFPGRVLSFLEARYEAFEGSVDAGMVIVPTELIVDNGIKLKDTILALAKLKRSSENFIQWLTNANDFCNSLVDCIVPGNLPAAEQESMEKQLGYEDQLMIMTEPYRLWAIETKRERTRKILSFSGCDSGVVVASDINKFRTLKLRLLNGTHTLSCGLACLAGFTTVKEAMNNEAFADYISSLMLQEICPLVVQNDISLEEADHFAQQVIDRFKNPFIEHLWLTIATQYTSKMAMRTVPLIEKQYAVKGEVPGLMALGFAAFFMFMRSAEKSDNAFYGAYNGTGYRINDDKAALLVKHWQSKDSKKRVENMLSDKEIFGADLTQYLGFADAVNSCLLLLLHQGVLNTLSSIFDKKSAV